MKQDAVSIEKYQHKDVEEKWRDAWEKSSLDTPDLAAANNPFYNLMMFPYPSAEGLHVGNMYAFTGSDIYGRFKRMAGYDVFEPIGLDGFGIHSENFALKIGRHPMDHAKITEKNYYNQLHNIGAMFDWTRTVETYDPDYYRWTQWLFVQMFKHGLCYRGKAEVNWCPGCKTVLADEQVIDNSCERCGKTVEKRQLEQWFFKITAYAEKLLQNSFSLDWAKKVKVAQQAWIGKKEGINITYPVVTDSGEKVSEVTCFTTRPDTNFGATFVVLAPEHPFVGELLGSGDGSSLSKRVTKQVNAVTTAQIHDYIDASLRKTAQERAAEGRKKTGVFTGFYCVNGLNDKKLPLYISDFVLADFGTGAVIGVPGHDKRDYEFAMQFDIDIERVVIAKDGDVSPISRIEQVQEEEGIMVNSGFLNGLPISEAIHRMMDHLEKKGWGKRVTTYHLRDWLISRQRYWGPPIPMIFCEACAQKGQSWFTHRETAEVANENLDSISVSLAEDAFSYPSRQPRSQSEIEQNFIGSPRSHFDDLSIGLLDNSAHWAVGWYPVPESDLPVVLPRIDDYKPGDDGVAPLAKHKDFYNVACPQCGSAARRETDVSDTFLDSSWYFLRYPSVGNYHEGDAGTGAGSVSHFEMSAEGASQREDRTARKMRHATKAPDGSFPWDPQITRRWLPVHMYTGGAEHSVLHLMYSRFVTMALHDWGYIDFDEPFSTFYAHGLVIKDGAKMSKSKGNVVNPDEYIGLYGADALRLYLMFTGPYDQGGDFRDSAMEGMSRWVQKVWRLAIKNISTYHALDSLAPSDSSWHSPVSSATVKKALHRAIKKVGEDIEHRRYNTAIAAMMELVNTIGEEGARLQTPERRSDGGQGVMGLDDIRDFLKMLAPFAPYMTEELFQRMKSTMTNDPALPAGRQTSMSNENGDTKAKTVSQYTFTKSISIHVQPWPVYDPKFLEEETVEIAVQVNGKLRDTIVVKSHLPAMLRKALQAGMSKVQGDVEKEARASERVARHLEGKSVKKVIFIPGKIINFVV
ncbi:MAG: leucine--tRNA ligase [Patescibacteria group bacterium]